MFLNTTPLDLLRRQQPSNGDIVMPLMIKRIRIYSLERSQHSIITSRPRCVQSILNT